MVAQRYEDGSWLIVAVLGALCPRKARVLSPGRQLAACAYRLDMAGNGEVQRHIRSGESTHGDRDQDAVVYPVQDHVAAHGATWIGAVRDCRLGFLDRDFPDYWLAQDLPVFGRADLGERHSRCATEGCGVAVHIMLGEVDVQLAADIASQPASWRVAANREHRRSCPDEGGAAVNQREAYVVVIVQCSHRALDAGDYRAE